MSTHEIIAFDQLPNAAYVGVNTVAMLFGCKPVTVWLRVRKNKLPRPRKFGAHTRWNVGELRKALEVPAQSIC